MKLIEDAKSLKRDCELSDASYQTSIQGIVTKVVGKVKGKDI
ncbi:MAG: hypothetical protein BMS9Abin25_1625 [Gammaproteobacteria bacterium]|nr:MAG: hypothetical protein BMS9Abin25_1625 [Gammaproteobacteria bacterium]